jgi:hypothetical protein
MHRSGRSALTGAIAKAVAHPGTNLIPVTACNPEGYWECAPRRPPERRAAETPRRALDFDQMLAACAPASERSRTLFAALGCIRFSWPHPEHFIRRVPSRPAQRGSARRSQGTGGAPRVARAGWPCTVQHVCEPEAEVGVDSRDLTPCPLGRLPAVRQGRRYLARDPTANDVEEVRDGAEAPDAEPGQVHLLRRAGELDHPVELGFAIAKMPRQAQPKAIPTRETEIRAKADPSEWAAPTQRAAEEAKTRVLLELTGRAGEVIDLPFVPICRAVPGRVTSISGSE